MKGVNHQDSKKDWTVQPNVGKSRSHEEGKGSRASPCRARERGIVGIGAIAHLRLGFGEVNMLWPYPSVYSVCSVVPLLTLATDSNMFYP